MRLRKTRAPDPLTKACATALAVAPDPWDIDVFVKRVGQHLGQLIRLVPSDDMGPQFNGLLTQEADGQHTIVYRRDVSPRQRDAIILHEVGHILLDHPMDPLASVRPLVSGNVSDALIARFLGRSVYEHEHEVEAETFATMLATHACTAPRRRSDRFTDRLR